MTTGSKILECSALTAIARLRHFRAVISNVAPPNMNAMRKRHDWAEIQRHYDAGHDPAQCRTRFGVTYSAWTMAIRRGKLEVTVSIKDRRRRHDWQAVQAYYDRGYSFYDCMQRFKFCRGAWHKAVQRGEVKPRPPAQPIDELLANGKSRRNIK